MKNTLLGLALLALGLPGCTSGDLHALLITDTMNGYASAIRWGLYENAQEYQNPAKRTQLDLAWLKNIHVTSYDQIYRKEAHGSDIYELTVEIRYFIEPYGAEKSLIDRQLWRYYDDIGKLMLESDLPTFR